MSCVAPTSPDLLHMLKLSALNNSRACIRICISSVMETTGCERECRSLFSGDLALGNFARKASRCPWIEQKLYSTSDLNKLVGPLGDRNTLHSKQILSCSYKPSHSLSFHGPRPGQNFMIRTVIFGNYCKYLFQSSWFSILFCPAFAENMGVPGESQSTLG